MQKVDDKFYDRADAHIKLANNQITEEESRGKVSASLMYATARFNAWVSACGWISEKEMAEAKKKTIEYFVEQYREMLEENLDDYIDNFEQYLNINANYADKDNDNK